MDLKFRNPPLDEVVIASYFPPIQPLQSQHIGRFWGSHLDEFPTCTQHAPLQGFTIFEDEPAPMPRFWLTSADDYTVIQIQKNCFIANWRRRHAEQKYPHYESVKKLFDLNLSRFTSYLSRALDYRIERVESLELAYINFLRPMGEDLNALSEIVNGAGPVPTSSTVSGFTLRQRMDLSPDLTIRLTIDEATKGPDKESGWRFELRAVGIPNPADWTAVSEWLDRAHDRIGDLFLSLVSEPAKQKWELHENV
jgi:uncharacterized protein (TIGR04255 family)